MEKTLLIIRGIPGSGKTTLSEYISMLNDAIVCSADDYFYDDKGNYNFDPNELYNAHKWCKEKAEFAMKNSQNVIIANTSVKEKEINPYIKMGNNNGYKIFSIIVENRHNGKNVHGVPNETISKMKNNFSLKL